jgi:hypothetical protein
MYPDRIEKYLRAPQTVHFIRNPQRNKVVAAEYSGRFFSGIIFCFIAIPTFPL